MFSIVFISEIYKTLRITTWFPSKSLELYWDIFVASEASDPTLKNIGIPWDLIRFLRKIRMQILGQKLGKNWIIFRRKKLEDAFFAVKCSIFVRFGNLKNWHLQIYQTKLTIWLKLMCDLKGPHNGNLKMNDPKKRENCLKNAQFWSDLKILKTGICRIIRQN